MEKINPFLQNRHEVPKNGLEILKWFLFEPIRLDSYESTLSAYQKRHVFLKMYLFRVVFTIGCLYVAGNAILTCMDVPTLGMTQKFDFQKEWILKSNYVAKLCFLLQYRFWGVAYSLLYGLLIGLILNFRMGLSVILAFSITFGFARGLSLDFIEVSKIVGFISIVSVSLGILVSFLTNTSAKIFIEKLLGGLINSLIIGFVGGLLYSLTVIIAANGNWKGSLVGSLVGGFATGGFYYMTGLGIWHTFLEQIMYFCGNTFHNNIFSNNERIWVIPIGVKKGLLLHAKETPEIALDFSIFLLEHRPLQHDLAAQIIHTANAALWYNAPLHEKNMIEPFIPKKQPDFQPSKDWETALQTAKKSWIAAQVETNPWFKQDKYVLFQADLIHFHRIHRTQSPLWAQLYYPALKKWEQEAAEMLKTLQQNNLGTVRNPYQTGLALTLQDEKIFLGRQKLRDTLQMHLLNAPQLPLFLIHGQRRVGKTSLLNFLQTLLGEYYMVVQQDLQGSTDCMSVEHWLTRLRQQIDQALQLPPVEWQATEDWLTSWEQLRQHLGRVTANQPKKLIIALDEYEGLHEKGFKHHPEKAGHLLGALRSFAQSQRAVVFLFIGAHYFFELQNPDWSHYFVHAQYLEVDYLTQSDSIQLVTQPYPQFPIRYAAELPQTIFEATNGHPALIQEICYALVLVANHQNRVDLTVADLQNVLDTVILVAHNNVIGRFWRGFCADWGVQETVLRVVQGETVAPKAVKELLLHQYIVPSAGGTYRMRVPLFEEWVLKFGLY